VYGEQVTATVVTNLWWTVPPCIIIQNLHARFESNALIFQNSIVVFFFIFYRRFFIQCYCIATKLSLCDENQKAYKKITKRNYSTFVTYIFSLDSAWTDEILYTSFRTIIRFLYIIYHSTRRKTQKEIISVILTLDVFGYSLFFYTVIIVIFHLNYSTSIS